MGGHLRASSSCPVLLPEGIWDHDAWMGFIMFSTLGDIINIDYN